MPFFSVVIPLYNKEDFIEETLKSVISQTFKDFEIMIVNDGSTDNSKKIAESFDDNRILILDQKNKGLCATRNRGIKTSKSKFVAFLDADDLWMEDFLETIYQLIQLHETKKVFATNVKLLTSKTKVNLSATPFDNEQVSEIKNYFKICKNIMGPSSMVIDKSVFEEVGYFDETINYGEEDDFYIRCFLKNDLIYYNGFKTYYRTGIDNQLTSANRAFERKIPVYDKYLIENDNNPDLKKFIDYVHYRLVVLFKMERNNKLVKFYKEKINVSNLTTIQKIKYHLPTVAFYHIKKIYVWFSKSFTHF